MKWVLKCFWAAIALHKNKCFDTSQNKKIQQYSPVIREGITLLHSMDLPSDIPLQELDATGQTWTTGNLVDTKKERIPMCFAHWYPLLYLMLASPRGFEPLSTAWKAVVLGRLDDGDALWSCDGWAARTRTLISGARIRRPANWTTAHRENGTYAKPAPLSTKKSKKF